MPCFDGRDRDDSRLLARLEARVLAMYLASFRELPEATEVSLVEAFVGKKPLFDDPRTKALCKFGQLVVYKRVAPLEYLVSQGVSRCIAEDFLTNWFKPHIAKEISNIENTLNVVEVRFTRLSTQYEKDQALMSLKKLQEDDDFMFIIENNKDLKTQYDALIELLKIK